MESAGILFPTNTQWRRSSKFTTLPKHPPPTHNRPRRNLPLPPLSQGNTPPRTLDPRPSPPSPPTAPIPVDRPHPRPTPPLPLGMPTKPLHGTSPHRPTPPLLVHRPHTNNIHHLRAHRILHPTHPRGLTPTRHLPLRNPFLHQRTGGRLGSPFPVARYGD